jgi:hypothetical protein
MHFDFEKPKILSFMKEPLGVRRGAKRTRYPLWIGGVAFAYAAYLLFQILF